MHSRSNGLFGRKGTEASEMWEGKNDGGRLVIDEKGCC